MTQKMPTPDQTCIPHRRLRVNTDIHCSFFAEDSWYHKGTSGDEPKKFWKLNTVSANIISLEVLFYADLLNYDFLRDFSEATLLSVNWFCPKKPHFIPSLCFQNREEVTRSGLELLLIIAFSFLEEEHALIIIAWKQLWWNLSFRDDSSS